MTQLSLSATVISSLPFSAANPKFYFDDKLPGFGVRVSKSAKSYIAQGRVSGRVRRVTIGAVGVFTVAEARREAKKVLGQLASEIDPNAVKAAARSRTMTLGEALEAYLAGRNLKPTTKQANRNLVHANFPDWLNTELRFVTPAMVVKRFDRISERSHSTANSSLRVLRALYNYARANTASDTGEYTLPENPCKRVSDLKRWHRPKRRKKYLTNDRFPAFFAGLKTVAKDTNSNRHADAGLVLADFAEFVLRTGLRKTEAATLAWDNVSFEARTITIGAERAKNGEELVLPISTQSRAILERRLSARTDSPNVFPGEGAGGALGDPRKTLQRLRDAIGDNELGFHDLRRTFAVQCERLDVSHSKIKRLLNHVDGGDVTMGYIVSTDPERLRAPVQSISDEIDRLALDVNHSE